MRDTPEQRALKRDIKARNKRKLLYQRTLEYYHREHERLLAKLGGACARCGKTKHLHIDHPAGRDWEPYKVSAHCRVRRYWREYNLGVPLQVLCKKCSGWAGMRQAKLRKLQEEEELKK